MVYYYYCLFAIASTEITLVKIKGFFKESILLEQTSTFQAQEHPGDQLFLLTLAVVLLFVPVTAMNAWHHHPVLGKPRAYSVPFP